MNDKSKTAQELCNYSSPAPTTPGQMVITLAEYNQVIDGLRMQLHLLSKRGNELAEKLKLTRAQRDDENWTVNACCFIAEAPSGWEETKETHAAVREVKKLRIHRDSLLEFRSRFISERIRLQKQIKNLQSAIRELRKK